MINKQTGKLTNKQVEKQFDKQEHIYKIVRQTNGERDRQTNRHLDMQVEKDKPNRQPCQIRRMKGKHTLDRQTNGQMKITNRRIDRQTNGHTKITNRQQTDR